MREIARTYAHVGMARSFHPLTEPEPALPVATIHHARSGRQYEVLRRGGRLVQRRYELGPSGAQVNAFEMDATHVIGSGNHARTYFHLTGAGELVELPLTWYAQENRWYLSPGFDQSSPPDFTRRADDSCLFCHNGYPRGGDDWPMGSIASDVMATARATPKWHPTAEPPNSFVRRSSTRRGSRAALQMDVCMQCHLETTSVELPQMIRRFDRAVFSFRPGEPLGDYMVHFDAGSGGDRFEIVNQAYRLRQSACFRASGGRLTCNTCHNPHDVPRGAAAVTWYRAKCIGCHPSVKAAGHPSLATADCAGCHMPKRRTEDAVHVVMTDHLIARRPRRDESNRRPRRRRAASRARSPFITRTYPPPTATCISARRSSSAAGTARPESRCSNAPLAAQPNGRALAVLAEGRLAEGDAAGAVRDFRRALERGPQTARLHYNLAQALDAAGQAAEAGREFEEALRLDPQFPEAHYAYGNHSLKSGDARGRRSTVRGRHPGEAGLCRGPEQSRERARRPEGLRRQHARISRRRCASIPAFAEAHDNEARVLAAQGQVGRRSRARPPCRRVEARFRRGAL